MRSGSLKIGLRQHVAIVLKRIGVAFRSRGQHDETKARHLRRGDSIRVRHKFYNRDPSTRTQCRVDSFQKPDALSRIEVVEKI